MPDTKEGSTKAEHPLTARVTLGAHVRKVYVRKMNGYFRLLRPKWRAGWGCWVVEDGGPQELFFDEKEGEFTVTRPALSRALQQGGGDA